MNRRGWLVVVAIIVVTVVTSHVFESGGLRGSEEPDGRVSRLDFTMCSEPAMIGRLSELREASGLTVSTRHPGILWSHNDSGQPVLHALGTDGAARARVRVNGATVDDWEAVASTRCARGSCLYIGDVGDNGENRKQITIYRVPEPALGDPTTAPAEAFHATYPDRPQDAEGIVVTPKEEIFVVTKGREAPVAIYRVPTPLRAGAIGTMQRVTTLWSGADKSQRVTDAALSADGRYVALRTHDAVLFYLLRDINSGRPGEAIKVDLRLLKEPQGEGIALGNDGTVYLAGESGGITGAGTLARLSCKLP